MSNPQTPRAQKQPTTLYTHGEHRTDEYYWLRYKSDPAVIDYLEQENQYTQALMKDTEGLQKQLFEEIKGRIQETDTSAPVKMDDFYYYERTEAGKEYPIFCRKKDSLDNSEEILLDQNQLAGKAEYCALGAFTVSPDHDLLAYSLDMEGSELYTVYVKDLNSGKLLEEMSVASSDVEWINNSKTFVYTVLDEIMRPYKIFSHELGADPATDTELLHEKDEQFTISLRKSRDKRYIFMDISSAVTDEVRYIRADAPASDIHTIQSREYGHEYHAENNGESFYILTNMGAEDYKIVKAPITEPDPHTWEDVIPHRSGILLQGMTVFAHHLYIKEISDATPRIRVYNLATGDTHYIPFNEDVYDVGLGQNPDFDTTILRFVYTSFTTPDTVFEYDMATGDRRLIKQDEILGGYDPDDYISRRIYAQTDDGANIPISLVHRKDISFDQAPPCWLVGYGAYGINEFPDFSYSRINLLERGFVYAFAHVRGGKEKGQYWYEDGKYLRKRNTVTDFIRTAEHLIETGYASTTGLVAHSGSAGGILLGTAINLRPDLFTAVIARVPFVDVLTTMLDDSLPLTAIEYDEWGNPNDREYYDYIRSYSPYDNVTEQNYPHLLVTAGLNDPRVPYWEPAKWAARLRAMKTDDNMLLLKTEMDKGHGGASGRYKSLQETAFQQAFALKALGLIKT